MTATDQAGSDIAEFVRLRGVIAQVGKALP